MTDLRKTLTDLNWQLTRAGLPFFSSKSEAVLDLGTLPDPGRAWDGIAQLGPRPSLALSWIERMSTMCAKKICELPTYPSYWTDFRTKGSYVAARSKKL